MNNQNNNKISLTIEQSKNKLNNLQLIETVDINLLKKLINSSLLKQTFHNPLVKFDNEKQQLEKYLKLFNNKGEAIINYTQTSLKFGRVFPKKALGLFSIRREIRHTLARDTYIDIDIDNCHPVLLSQICKSNNISCNYLNNYIKNRAKLLKEYMEFYKTTKDIIKQLFIQLLYFGSFESWVKNNNIEVTEPKQFITDLKNELNLIGDYIVNINPKLLKIIQSNKKEQNIVNYNIKGSVCSYFLQEYESRILETIYLYCVDKKLINNNNCVLCADGLMIKKNNYNPQLLLDFKELIKNNFYFDLNFSEKVMNQGYSIKEIENSQIINNKEDEDYIISVEDLNDPFKTALKIGKSLKNNLILCKESWYMISNDNLWKKEKEPSYYIIKELRKYIDESNKKIVIQISNLIEGKEKENLINSSKEYLKSYTNISKPAYLNVLTKYLKSLLTDNYFNDRLDSNAGFLAFKNGIVDLKTKNFREGILSTDYITDTIQHNYIPSNYTYLKSILKKILNNNDEHLDYFLGILGYTFIGQASLEKSVYYMIDKTESGKGDNGKTFFFDILLHLMPYYVYKTKASLLEKNNTKIHKQLANTKGKRLTYMEEIPPEKDTNAELLKEIGDGKTIENEIMYGTSEIIKIMFKLFALSNFIPKIDPTQDAVYNRYKQISFNSHFDRSGERKEEDPDNLLFIADVKLSDKIKKDHYNEVFNIIIDYAYNYYINGLPSIPSQFLEDTKETKTKNDVYACWFNDNCKSDVGYKVALKKLMLESKMTEAIVKEGMKRLGFKYNKELKGIGKDQYNKYYKGGYEGIDIIEELEYSHPDDL